MKAAQALVLIVVATVSFAAGRWLDGADDPTDVAADPEALREALHIPEARGRAGALATLLDQARPQDAAALRQVLVEESNYVDEVAELLFAEWWASFDAPAALEQRLNPAWPDRHPWLRSVFLQWARQDLAAASAAVEELPAGTRTEATRSLLDGWAGSDEDPTPLVGLIRELAVKPRGLAVKLLLDRMIEHRGLEETMAFVEAQPDDSMEFSNSIKNELMGRMGVAIAEVDTERARAWAREHGLGKGRQGLGVLLHLAHFWALQDGPAAMDWALSIEDEPFVEQEVVIRTFMSFQALQRDEARRWLDAHRPNPNLRAVYLPYLRELVSQDPERAVELASRAEDTETRDALLMAVARNWLRVDREAAEFWIDGGGLPPEVAEQLSRSPAPIRRPPPRRTKGS